MGKMCSNDVFTFQMSPPFEADQVVPGQVSENKIYSPIQPIPQNAFNFLQSQSRDRRTLFEASQSPMSPMSPISSILSAQNRQPNGFHQPGALPIDTSNVRRWQWSLPFAPPANEAFSPAMPFHQRILRRWNMANMNNVNNTNNVNSTSNVNNMNVINGIGLNDALSLSMPVNPLPYRTLQEMSLSARSHLSCPNRMEARPNRPSHSIRHSRRSRPSRLLQPEYSQRFGS